ncbi:MAG: hypothetical protein HUK20_06085 [Fibrobacter sp.]|nr:hypothetical protein [Fibrobacter sp.]
MADNITTVLDKDDAGNLNMGDILYLIQGTGADRDRKVSLAKLLYFIRTEMKKIVLNGSKCTIEIDSDTGKISMHTPDWGGFSLEYRPEGPTFTTGVIIENGGLTADDRISTSGSFEIINEDGSPTGYKLSKDLAEFKRVKSNSSEIVSASVSEYLDVLGGKFSVSIAQVLSKLKLIVQNELIVTDKADFKGPLNCDSIIQAGSATFTNSISAKYLSTKIFIATTTSQFNNPAGIQGASDVIEGGEIIVKNGTGSSIDIEFLNAQGNRDGLIRVENGECMRYIKIDGSFRRVW